MNTTLNAINRVYALLKGSTAITMPIFKLVKPTRITPDEYLVINALPVTMGPLQKCRVNVNFYCKDIESGTPNYPRLETVGAALVTLLLRNNDNATGIYLDLESQETVKNQETDYHYMNFRLHVKLLNK
jgi:hypothetical protein